MTTTLILQQQDDIEQVTQVNELTFETPAKVKLFKALIQSETETISLVAKDVNQIVGHLLLSKV